MHNSTLNYKGTELSKRTFHNHRQAILTELGVDIQCSSMRENSQYFIANQEELENNEVLNWLTGSMATESLLLENKAISDKIDESKLNDSVIFTESLIHDKNLKISNCGL